MVRLIVLMVTLSSAVFVQAAYAAPSTRLHVLAIGYNGTPRSDETSSLRELRYADDDAVAFARLAHDLGGHAILLSNFDADTTRRFPDLARRARPALLTELRRAVRELNISFAEDRRLGLEPQLLLTYSGHGVAETGQVPALVLGDGELTQDTLYSEVLSALDSVVIHLVVDACHAEAVVRPRDLQAETIPLTSGEIQAALTKVTLRGLRHVGSMIASSASAQAHEWERWQQGVFTHEVISGLRGAADVNGDLRVEYSEMAAFLSAANREVNNGAARIKPLLGPPSATPRTAIVDLRAGKDPSFLLGRPGQLGALFIESEDGERIADLRSEANHYVRVLVPTGRPLFVRSADGEAAVTVGAGERVSFASLRMRPRAMSARGALDVSLQRGLFAAPFGPSYYRGFVDQADELLPVPLATPRNARIDAALSTAPSDRGPSPLAWSGLGVTGALLIASATLGIAALDAHSDFEAAAGLERESFAANERFETYCSLTLGTAIASAVSGGISYVLFTQP
jgi:hypothetical protein